MSLELTRRERAVLEARTDGMSLDDAARLFHTDRLGVRRIEVRALMKARGRDVRVPEEKDAMHKVKVHIVHDDTGERVERWATVTSLSIMLHDDVEEISWSYWSRDTGRGKYRGLPGSEKWRIALEDMDRLGRQMS